MVDPTLAVGLNNQYNFERYSSAVYVALAAHLDGMNLVGMAKYLRQRAGEENAHAEKFYEYIIDRDVLLVVDALPKPEPCEQQDPMQAGMACFSLALEHERKVTNRIESLYELSRVLGDGRTAEFLHFYLHEQVEEERSLEEILTRFNLAAGNGAGILLVDAQLGA